MEKLILVNKNDEILGTMEKMEVHRKGLLHRAVSVFLFNDMDEMLLQKRAQTKYHSPGLWTNTCCGHPRPNEDVKTAASRRLLEEMGIETSITKKFDFIYKASVENSLIENEFDHVFFGKFNGTPILNPDEVSDYKWTSILELKNEIKYSPSNFTIWFKLIINNHF